MTAKLFRNSLFAVVLVFASGGFIFSQDNSNGLMSYLNGRALESRNYPKEANVSYSDAVRICNDVIARNEAGRDTYTILTWALLRQKKYADVITWGERGLRLYADEYRIVETMGEAYFYQTDYDSSLKFMQRYANSSPDGERISVAYFFIGEIYRLRKQYLHADIAYTTAVRLQPGLALWWYRLGSVREAAGSFSHAAEAYEQAVKLNPNYPEASNGLARSRRQAG